MLSEHIMVTERERDAFRHKVKVNVLRYKRVVKANTLRPEHNYGESDRAGAVRTDTRNERVAIRTYG